MDYILVTGGSRGIGKAISIVLAQAGYPVIINYVRDSLSAEIAKNEITDKGGIADVLQFDISNYTETDSVISSWARSRKNDKITGVVCNAGIKKDRLFATMSPQEWNEVINTNLNGTFNTIKSVLPYMVRNKYGRIVNISSVSGITGIRGQANYCAAKAGIIGLTKSLALELAPKNITVNCIAPGYIKTDMLNGLDEKNIADGIPVKRLGYPEEIANSVLYFMNKDNAYVTGAVLSINGGMYV